MRIGRNQRGDTIVEVLICVAVLSFVLSAAFSLANRSSQTNTRAGERGESSKVTESQIEMLKSFISQSATPAIPPDGNFCMYVETVSGVQSLKIEQPVSTPANLESYPAKCKSGVFYNTYIQKVGNVYTAHTRWYNPTGGVDETTMVYRVYPDLASTNTGVTGLVGCNAPIEYMNSIGGCVPCDPGYQNLLGGFSMAPCSPIPPRVRIVVQKITPDAGNNTPSCSKAGTDANGIPVRLTGPGGPFTGTSTALIDVPSYSTSYTASYNPIPSGFESCDPVSPGSSKNVTTSAIGTASPANVRQVTFKVRPICYTQSVFDSNHWHSDWHDHGFNHQHGYYETVTWWQHTGPDGRHAEWNKTTSPYSTQPNEFYRWEGATYVKYGRVGSLYNSAGPFYNRFERWSNTSFVVTENHWHSDLHDHGSNHVHYRDENVCPT